MYKNEEIVSDVSNFPTGDYVSLESLTNLNWTSVDDYSLLQNQEDTMDACTKFGQIPQEFVPFCPVGPPDRTIFTGDLNFEIQINSIHINRSKYVYSHRLNRIYVDMGYSFSVMFKWDAVRQPCTAMYVRATVVFSDEAQAGKRVTRCIQHYHDTAKNGVEMTEAMRSSVLHSASEAGAADVYYCGGGAGPDGFPSLLVRLQAPAAHAYQFACKNSCSSGINRRTIAVLFTLEDHTGHVYGRQSVGARVCSCPKRDMAREEDEAPRGKRALTPSHTTTQPPAQRPLQPASRPKRIRLEVVGDSDEPIQLPPIKVLGRRVFNTGLGVMLSMMEEKRAIHVRNHLPTEEIDSSIAQLKVHLDKGGDSQ